MATANKKIGLGAKIGAGLVAAGAVAAAGYYFYGSKNAKQHRGTASTWANNLKKEVLREARGLKNMSAGDFADVVDSVVTTYKGVRSINAADLKRATNELKSNWKMVQRELEQEGKKTVSRARTVGRHAVSRGKKTVQKVAKKVR
jgi:hypothetical protein